MSHHVLTIMSGAGRSFVSRKVLNVGSSISSGFNQACIIFFVAFSNTTVSLPLM